MQLPQLERAVSSGPLLLKQKRAVGRSGEERLHNESAPLAATVSLTRSQCSRAAMEGWLVPIQAGHNHPTAQSRDAIAKPCNKNALVSRTSAVPILLPQWNDKFSSRFGRPCQANLP